MERLKNSVNAKLFAVSSPGFKACWVGDARITVRNLKVLRVDVDNNLLLVEGSVPGGPGGYVTIRKAIAAKPIRVAQAEPVKKKGKK